MAPPEGVVDNNNYKPIPTTTNATRPTDGDINDKPPPIMESSLTRRKTFICSSFTFLTVICGLLYQYSKNTEFNISTKPEYCASYYPITSIYHPENPKFTTCFRHDLFAIQIAFGIPLFYVALRGMHSWYISKENSVHTVLPNTPEGRLFGYSPANDDIATINFVFQVWDFVFSWFVPEYCSVLMMCHHAMSALVCFYSIHWQFLSYYGGLTEISSMFLLFIDFAKYFPPIQSSKFESIVAVCQICFILTFFYYRVYKWNVVSYQLWKDVYSVTVETKSAQRYRPKKVYVLYVYLVCNVLLSVLQFFWWCFEIMPAIVKTIQGK